MNKHIEEHRTKEEKLENVRHLMILTSVTEMTIKVRKESEQKTNGVYVNNTKLY